MKLSVFATATLFGSLLLPPAHAQVIGAIQGKIPFDFAVGNKVLPAGNYVVRQTGTTQGVLALQNADHKAITIMFLASPVQAGSAEKTKLVFHRYGNTYFLSQVWPGLGQDGSQLIPSKSERAAAERMAAVTRPGKPELASATFHRK
jgi:hypothetical protein